MSTTTLKTLQAAYPEAAIVHGWHLAGPGPARFGWAAKFPAGRTIFLGRSLARRTAAVWIAENENEIAPASPAPLEDWAAGI